MTKTTDKKAGYKIPIQYIQPWSTFVMRTKLPPDVLKKMIKSTDKIITNKKSTDWGKNLAGQINEELLVENEVIERAGLMPFFVDVVKKFAIQQTLQSFPYGVTTANDKKFYSIKDIINGEWFSQIVSMWIVSQKDNEYNPCHIHTGCHMSAVMYLKIPKYLKPRKQNESFPTDGAITFFHNASSNDIWGDGKFAISPEVGDFFIFPSTMVHSVYPFRTANKKGERRSVSFNSVFSSECMPYIKFQTPEGNKFESY